MMLMLERRMTMMKAKKPECFELFLIPLLLRDRDSLSIEV